MASFSSLVASLNLNIQNFSNGLRNASNQAKAFSASLKGQINNGLVEPAKKAKVEFKDVARIVQGIIISKVFYSGLNSIRQATEAVWDFSQQLEYAQIAYSNLFGDTSLSTEFINVLKDFAAVTPFSFTESEKAAKRLLAYGVKYQNVMYVMQGIMSAAAMQGDPAKVESISRALGQIYTKGRLMGDEMKQLTEAGIPAWEILQEKIGLTADQIGRVGDAGIPASVAINALVDGMTERFGGVVEASSKTITGIISNIKDNATMLAAGLAEPFVYQLKGMLNALGQFLFKLRDVYELTGPGGVFEELIPEEVQDDVRMMLARLSMLRQAIVNLAIAASKLLTPAFIAFMHVINAMAPILATTLNILAALITIIAENAVAVKVLASMLAVAATMWVIFKIRALACTVVAGVINLISKALKGLHVMLTFVLAHPFWTLLIGIGGLLVGLLVGFDKVGNSINNMMSKLTKAAGYDPDKLLLPSQKDRANDIEKFNKKLDGTADSMDNLADSTGKATKAANGLLSFDEVFKLKEPDEGTGKGLDTGLDFEGMMGDLSGETFMPEVPDFTGFSNNFVQKLIESLKEKLLGAGIGAIIGAVFGGLLGGPLGAKIGAVAGAIAGWFWNDLSKALGLTDLGKIALPIATVIGGAIGFRVGGPAGMAIGAGIGTLVGWIIDRFKYGIETGDWSDFTRTMNEVAGAGIGAIIGGGLTGSPIGAAIGAVVGAIAGFFWEKLADAMKLSDVGKVSVPIGTLLGAAIGGVAGGPAGLAIGAGIGTLVGWVIDKMYQLFSTASWSEIADAFKAWGLDIGKAFLDGMFSDGGLFGWTSQIFKAAADFFADAKEAFESKDWGEFGKNILLGILAGLTGALTFIFEPIARVFTGIVDAICAIFGIHSPATALMPYGANILFGLLEGIVGAIGSIPKYIAEVGLTIINTIGGWFTNISTTVSTWLHGATVSVADFVVNTGTSIANWASSTYSNIANWVQNTSNNIANWVRNTGDSIANWAVNAATSIGGFVLNTIDSVSTWAANTGAKIASWAKTTSSKISTWWKNVDAKFGALRNTSFDSWASRTYSTISSWASNVSSAVSSAFDSAISKIKEFLNISGSTSAASNVVNTAKSMGITAKSWANMTAGSTAKSGTALYDKYKNYAGHASGGIFNREHYARFAEDNKAEAIIPLEEDTAMQPFVDAVATGLTTSLAPMFATFTGQQQQMQPLYVGTLVADERSLRELERKMKVIRMQEDRRG